MVFREDACMSNALIWTLNCFEAAKKFTTNFFAKSAMYTYLRHRNTQRELKSLSILQTYCIQCMFYAEVDICHIYTKSIRYQIFPYIIITKLSSIGN